MKFRMASKATLVLYHRPAGIEWLLLCQGVVMCREVQDKVRYSTLS